MDGLTVSDVASRSGVPASTVRFYEAEGLLPARRSASGYRLYDDVAVQRLRFIGTAKGLGLPLAEIRDLLDPWEHGQCSDVQGELAPLVARHLADTDDRIARLRELGTRLRRARQQLAAIDHAGPCDPSCESLGDGGGLACSLGGSERVERGDQWRSALATVTGRTAIPNGVRLALDPGRTPLGELARLAAAESSCCPFFDISLRFADPPTLDVHAPAEASALVHELFGEPDVVS